MEEVYRYTRSPAWEELVGKSLLKKRKRKETGNLNRIIDENVMSLQSSPSKLLQTCKDISLLNFSSVARLVPSFYCLVFARASI